MRFCVPRKQKVTVLSEHGIARHVFIDGNEVVGVTDVNISYGIDTIPKLTIVFYASEVSIIEQEEDNSGDPQGTDDQHAETDCG